MSVARVATFDEPHSTSRPFCARTTTGARKPSMYLLRSLPGFVAGYSLREPATQRLMSVTVWESERALDAAEQAVRDRAVSDQPVARRALGRRRQLLVLRRPR